MGDGDVVNDTPTRRVENGYLIGGGAGDEKPAAVWCGDERRGGKIIRRRG
jgi:hypothetical protein